MGSESSHSSGGLLTCSGWLSSIPVLSAGEAAGFIGEVAEWPNAPVLKTGVGSNLPWVRIPPSPLWNADTGTLCLSLLCEAKDIFVSACECGTGMKKLHFAIVPAAGKSHRMPGRHKLLLPWGSETVIHAVLHSWMSSRVTHVVVVIRPDDQELPSHLHELKQRFTWNKLHIVAPDSTPPSMRDSVVCGLEHVNMAFHPARTDRWLLAPADIPSLSPSVTDGVITASEQTDQIVTAVYGGHQSHPVSFPWRTLEQIGSLSTSEGIDSLMNADPVRQFHVAADLYPGDIDTPEEYSAAVSAFQAKRNAGRPGD